MLKKSAILQTGSQDKLCSVSWNNWYLQSWGTFWMKINLGEVTAVLHEKKKVAL